VSLRLKLLLPQLAVMLSIITYLYGVWMPAAMDEAEAKHLSLVERHLETVEQGLIPLILGNQLDIIYENLSALQETNRDWVNLRLVNAHGRQLYPLLATTKPPQSGANRRSISHPIALNGLPLGSLTVEIDIDPALKQLHAGHQSLALMVLIMLAFMLAAGNLTLELAVRRPLRHLAEASQALAHRDYDAALPAVRRDEMGALVSSFAAMRDELKSNEAELRGEIAMRRDGEQKLRDSVEMLAKQREDLERSNAELEQFAYIASHDLQTPLRNIVSYSQLLERSYKDRLDDDANLFIGFIIDNGKRMTALIKDLLRYSRISNPSEPLAAISAAEAVRQAIKNLDTALEENQAEITLGELPLVIATGPQLVSLFQNLLSNAIRYRAADRAPRISVTAEPDGAGMWRFAVSDNGIGIDPLYHEKIFEIFQRLHPSGEREGTGIGLTMCRRILHRFGGKIWLSSTPGQGSTFFFTLHAANKRSEA